MPTMGEYIADCINKGGKVDNVELQRIMREQAQNMGFKVQVDLLAKCPECLKEVHQDELNAFGGLCEECTQEDGIFNERL